MQEVEIYEVGLNQLLDWVANQECAGAELATGYGVLDDSHVGYYRVGDWVLVGLPMHNRVSLRYMQPAIYDYGCKTDVMDSYRREVRRWGNKGYVYEVWHVVDSPAENVNESHTTENEEGDFNLRIELSETDGGLLYSMRAAYNSLSRDEQLGCIWSVVVEGYDEYNEQYTHCYDFLTLQSAALLAANVLYALGVEYTTIHMDTTSGHDETWRVTTQENDAIPF